VIGVCICLQSIKSQTTVIFIVTALRTSNPASTGKFRKQMRLQYVCRWNFAKFGVRTPTELEYFRVVFSDAYLEVFKFGVLL
jgi:hypothetical protein